MRHSAFSLDKKTIFVSGASSGLGRSISIECSKNGAVLIISGRNETRLQKTLDSLHGSGHAMIIADMMNEADLENLASSLPKSIDGLVLAAGITKTVPVKFISKSDIHEILQTNTIASMTIIQLLLKKRKINKNGSIVFISSISTAYADMGNSVYAASKGAINSFSKVLALELASKKITSNCIQPGFVPTSMLAKGIVTDDQLSEERKRYPLGFGEPSDIANGAIYLLSDAAKWVTGSVITIDGGVTLR
jgi:NAD(P)-dependent dehydrogenase (short-subunit alcohol dehydrogenase family)